MVYYRIVLRVALVFTIALLFQCSQLYHLYDYSARPSTDAAQDSIPSRSSPITTADYLCSKDNWCWVNPLPQGSPIQDAWVLSTNEMWAVGLDGKIFMEMVPSGNMY